MKKVILVTGGAGFIGTNLCNKLVEMGHKVFCLDNLSSSRKFPKNVYQILNADVKTYSHSVYWSDKFDEIYHLACPASPPRYQEDPIDTMLTNVVGTKRMLDLATLHKSRILLTSTSEIYGNPEVHPQVETYRGNVNSIGPRSCFSDDTEILTFNGWKNFKDVTMDDKICTLNKNHEIEYHNPVEIIKEKYSGKLIKFKNYQCDLSVTPNHNMYAKPRSSKEWQTIPASKIPLNRCSLLKTAIPFKGTEQQWFNFESNELERKNSKIKFIEKIPMDIWLEFLGYYISEGSCDSNKRKRIIKGKEYITANYRILIAQDKNVNPDKWEKINSCLKQMPFNFGYYGHQFTINNKQLFYYLVKFGKAKDKYIPRELMNLSSRQLKILLDALILGDGSIGKTKQNKTRISYTTASKKLADNFQELLLKIGLAGNILINKRNIFYFNILNLSDRDRFNFNYPSPKFENYDGYVYCVNVPNHLIFVRRNGKALWCANCYDEGKRAAECLMYDYQRLFGTNIRVARIFNTYGPYMDLEDGRVVTNLIRQILKREDVTIYGNGSQTRSFCYVDDMVDGLIKLMESDYTQPVNLGNPNEITINQLFQMLRNILKKEFDSDVYNNPLPQDDPERRKPDISLAKKILDWEPQIPLEIGLRKTIEYAKKELGYC